MTQSEDTMTKTRDLEYIAVRLDAIYRLARDPEVRARVVAAKSRLCRRNDARPSRDEIAAELDAVDAVDALAKATSDLRGRAAAVTMKRWAIGTISETECNVLLGLADDAPGWPGYPTREDVAAKLDEVYELAKADGDSGGMAGARLAKLRLYGEIDEAEYREWLGGDEADEDESC